MNMRAHLSFVYFKALLFALSLVAQSAQSQVSSSATTAQRFVPVGSDPEVALDTQKGALCRTVQPTHNSSDKYLSLPMCSGEATSKFQINVTESDWKRTPLEASCGTTEKLLPLLSVEPPITMEVSSPCIISNKTNEEQKLVGNVAYEAVLRNAAGETSLRLHVGLASKEKTILPHRSIEGGLWTSTECASGSDPKDCLKTWLSGATEMLLVVPNSTAYVRVLMDRDQQHTR